MRKVIGIGETILDIIFKDNSPCRAVPGGTVFNGMVSLSRMGVSTTFISELGNDQVGNIIASFMKENNLPTDFIDRYPDGKSPVALAFLDEKQNAGYMVFKDYPAQRLEVSYPQINEDDIFILGSYYALNPALRSRVVEFLRYAQERKAIIYYDPNFRKPHADEALRLRPDVLENFEFADIVRGSDEDFSLLFGKTDMQEIYDEYVSFHCSNLIVTHAAEGADLYMRRQPKEHFDAPVIQPVSTIGAGDNFNAGLIYGMLKYNIRRNDLPTLSRADWEPIINCGMAFAANVCLTFDNYISLSFADEYRRLS
ncbi:MAG: carbohydrate kinase [Tannerellaceae bacterium]|jgi:fructokinase|nr:carbohydrate kinase [Tannerellaceae bacterium]